MNKLICVMCDSSFSAKRSDTKYCSQKCRSRKETMQRREKIRKQRQKVYRNCLQCSKRFEVNIRVPKQKYCSISCQKKCLYNRRVKSGKTKQYSKEYSQRNPKKIQEINSQYKNETRFGGNKFKVLERDNFECTECGNDKRSSLIIHHLDHSGSSEIPNNEMGNLTTLCRSCHMRHHASGKNNYLHKEVTKKELQDARESSSSWVETARKLNMHPDTLRKKRKKLGMI